MTTWKWTNCRQVVIAARTFIIKGSEDELNDWRALTKLESDAWGMIDGARQSFMAGVGDYSNGYNQAKFLAASLIQSRVQYETQLNNAEAFMGEGFLKAFSGNRSLLEEFVREWMQRPDFGFEVVAPAEEVKDGAG